MHTATNRVGKRKRNIPFGQHWLDDDFLAVNLSRVHAVHRLVGFGSRLILNVRKVARLPRRAALYRRKGQRVGELKQ